jgi:hypothetical protein
MGQCERVPREKPADRFDYTPASRMGQVVLTSNKHVSDCRESSRATRPTTAILGRLLHQGNQVHVNGCSCRHRERAGLLQPPPPASHSPASRRELTST